MRKREGCVLGIEPNEHQIPRFQGKYSYHTHLPENPERPKSPYISVVLGGGRIQRLSESLCFMGIGENNGIEMKIL